MNTKKVSLEHQKILLNMKLLINTKLLAKYRISNDETVISGLNQSLASELSATIDNEVKPAQLFSLIIESTIDISRIDQMSVSLHSVLKSGHVVERFIGFYTLVNSGWITNSALVSQAEGRGI